MERRPPILSILSIPVEAVVRRHVLFLLAFSAASAFFADSSISACTTRPSSSASAFFRLNLALSLSSDTASSRSSPQRSGEEVTAVVPG